MWNEESFKVFHTHGCDIDIKYLKHIYFHYHNLEFHFKNYQNFVCKIIALVKAAAHILYVFKLFLHG